MELTIKLLPPYAKNGIPVEHALKIESLAVDLQQLAAYLSREWKDKLDYDLIDDNNLLTAEFMVNGKHAPVEQKLKDGDHVTVVHYIFGG